MNRLSDIISRIFSTDQTQGLSGGAEVVIDQDPASAFYASRLRKHRSDEDLVDNPTWLWATVSYNQRKGGLRSHIAAERGEGVASFTDVLIVLNQADARRAAQLDGEPWTERAARSINERFAQFCQKERFELLYGTRPLRYWFVADGGQDMLGHSFGLGPGEFITGLLPNLYVGPAPRSRPVLAVHLNLPGAWEGYREVGRLFSDQILFTLGRHWLDNFHHPKLREPGLYRLQQFPDGSLVHVISPELQDRYFVRSDALEGGASVLTIAERTGTPVAYLVLAVVETPATAEPGLTMQVPLAALSSGFDEGATEVRVVDESAEPPRAPPEPAAPRRDLLQRTIIPDAVDSRMLTLHERGALLQKVHFANFMDGYDVYVGSAGRIATQMVGPRATLQVRGNRVSLLIGDEGVRVDGRPVHTSTVVPLAGTLEIEVDGHTLYYRDLTDVRLDGWPYLGELRRPGTGTYLDFGDTYRVGRDRRCKVRLPDEPHNDNIAWLSSVGTGATIRSRTGDIPKSRFYTDSIMVASEHAELDLTAEPVLRSLARHCYTFVRRDGEILSLAPREAEGRHDLELLPNDEVLVGNCLFQVAYPPPSSLVAVPMTTPPPGMGRPSAVELAALVDTPPAAEVSESPAGAAEVNRPLPRYSTYDPAVAAALGESGPAPRPPRLKGEGPEGTAPVIPPPAARELGGATELGAPPASRRPRSPASLPDPQEVPPGPATVGLATASPPPPVASAALTPPGREPLRPVPTDPGSAGLFARPPAALPPPPRLEPKPSPVAVPPPPMILEEPPARAEPDQPLFEELTGEHDGSPVLSVEEARWKVELARPARLVQVGWMVSGEVVVGNHSGCRVVVPEVRAFREQAFLTLDYFRLTVRGRRGNIELLQEGDASLHAGGRSVSRADDLGSVELRIVRRDQNLEPDFDVVLHVVPDETLPDPRAQVLSIDTSDRLVTALFTVGFPLRSERRTRLGRFAGTFRWDGARLLIADYLRSYRTDQGFLPAFYRSGDRPWQTLPEDGAAIDLAPGDGLIIGTSVYRFVAG